MKESFQGPARGCPSLPCGLRATIAVIALLGLSSAGCADEASIPPPQAGEWRIGYIVSAGEDAEATVRGARLGAQEATRAGDLIGASLSLFTEVADGPRAAVRVARRLNAAGASAIIGGTDEETCRALSEWAENAGALYLNVGCRADSLRRPGLRNTFHIEASDSMYRSASGEADGANPVLWHPSLFRYGAAQLNERFERDFASPPQPQDWTGWMGIKLLWESLLNTGSAEPAALAAFLAGDRAHFDGHKGEPLSFDASTRQLLQPLYLTDPGTGGLLGGRDGTGPRGEALPTAEEVGLDEGPYVFVSNEGSGDVTVIDVREHRAVAVIPLGGDERPRGIHVSPDGSAVFVALSDDAPGTETGSDAVARIPLPLGRVADRHSAGTDPEQFAISPDGLTLYASNEDAGTTSIIDLETGEVLATLVVGIEPEGVAVSVDGRWVYVTAETSNTISVIDTERRDVVDSFLVGVRPRGVAFSTTLPRAYVTNEISGTVSVVDTNAHEVIETIDLEGDLAKPVGLAVSPDGSRVYVANGYANEIAVIDAGTNRVVQTVEVGERPWGVAVSSDGRHVYSANGLSHDVSVIDASTLRVVATVPVGTRPWGVATMP